jgi:signal peptidase
MKKIVWNLVFSLVIMLMVVAMFIYIVPHTGWSINTLVSGSMEPTLKTGSLIVSHPAKAEEIVVGDIITFLPVSVGETMITHRVTRIEKNSAVSFYTKGDANSKQDPFEIPARNLIGKMCFHIPYCGYFIEFLKTPLGFVFSIIVPSISILVMYVFTILRLITETKKGTNL